MIAIASLRDKHAGRPGAVLCGGPSLEADLRRIPKDAVLIAVNHHAMQYVCADYTVFLDDVPSLRLSLAELRARGGLLVSRQQESCVDLGGSTWWQGRFSGHLATWLACYLGCAPVLVAGADLYQNPPPEDDIKNLAYQTPLAEHLAGWREAFKRCPHPERIRAISGPLIEIFGRFIVCQG